MIAPISPISISGLAQLGNATGVQNAPKVSPADPTGGNAFAAQLDKLTGMQHNVDQLAVQAATGDLQSIQNYTIASTEAQLMTQLTVTVRDKAVEAFNDIMRMQV
jgi:flagellar hook-basal body complex protein FliE